MTVRKRGKPGRWWYDFQIRGIRYRESIPEAQTKRDALDVEAEMRRAVYEGRYGRQTKNISFEKFITDVFKPYAEINRKRHSQDMRILATFSEIFKGRNLNEIPPMLLEQAKKRLLNEPIAKGGTRKASTVNQKFSVLRRVFSLAVENGYLNANPLTHVRKLKQDEPTDRVLFADEETALRSAMTTQVRFFPLTIFFELVMQTGMREAEACYLSPGEVDLQKRLIKLTKERTKEGKEKVIPLNDRAYALLTDRLPDVDKYFVGVSAGHLRSLWTEVCAIAGVKGITIHGLRHTVSTRMAEAGVPDAVRMALFGHSTVKMTQHYTHPGIESLGAAVETLSRKSHNRKVKRGVFGK